MAGLEQGVRVHDLRLLSVRHGLPTEAFAARYGIPAEDYAEYESSCVRHSVAVTAYLRVIVAKPEVAAHITINQQ